MKRMLILLAAFAAASVGLSADRLALNQSFTFAAQHDGGNTTAYRLYLDGVVQQEKDVSDLSGGQIAFTVPAFTTPGIHSMAVAAVSTDGEVLTAEKALTVGALQSGGVKLRLVHWNVRHGGDNVADGNKNHTAQMELMASLDPDLVSMNEIYDGAPPVNQYASFYETELERLTGDEWEMYFPGQQLGIYANTTHLAAKGGGTGLLSGQSLHHLANSRYVVHAQIAVNGRTVHIFDCHLTATSATSRQQEANALVTVLGGFTGDKLLTGDFNAQPGESTTWTPLNNVGYADALAGLLRTGDLGYTYKNWTTWSSGDRYRIDYWRFSSTTAPNVTLLSGFIAKTHKSDHSAVVVDVDVQ